MDKVKTITNPRLQYFPNHVILYYSTYLLTYYNINFLGLVTL